MKQHVLLQTITSEATNPISLQSVKSCLLFDGGSQRTYVSKALTDQLGLKSEKVELKNVTFGRSESTVLKTYLATMNLKLNNGTGRTYRLK